MTEQTQPPQVQPVLLYGTAAGTAASLHDGTATWRWRTHEELLLQLDGPFGDPITVAAPDLHRALLVLGGQLPSGWLPVVQAARRDAWHSTSSHPCRFDEVRLYPEFGAPPAATPVPALDTPDVAVWSHLARPSQAWLYHQEWAGQPRELSWSAVYGA